jgi:CDP-paratose 2-epimerase
MRVLITGGAGFIGTNTALGLGRDGSQVTVLDDLSRRGSDANLAWLRQQIALDFEHVDVRDARRVDGVVAGGRYDAVIHLAAQVAVTTSVEEPRHDLEVNVTGTFNVLEAVRRSSPDTVVLFASTNKVYGQLEELEVRELDTRYELAKCPHGVAETQPLDFHSPYGCSKGAADQYVIDYARIYGLRTVCFRQSCCYGYRQFGIEDQGWVAWFIIAHALGRPVTIFGDGKQVRDVLFADDLVDAFRHALERIDTVSGRAYNIGGGPENTLSLLELMEQLRELTGRPVEHSFADWRPGDQPVFVSDIRRAAAELDWAPKVSPAEGVAALNHWVETHLDLFRV